MHCAELSSSRTSPPISPYQSVLHAVEGQGCKGFTETTNCVPRRRTMALPPRQDISDHPPPSRWGAKEHQAHRAQLQLEVSLSTQQPFPTYNLRLQTMEEPAVCLLCNNLATTECPKCDALLYSSEECLLADAPSHGLVCPTFASLPPTPNSEGKHVLGVLFPADTIKPELVWVSVSGFADEDTGISFQEAEVGPFFAGVGTPQSLHSERNRVRNRDTCSMLEVWHAVTGPANPCIQSIATGFEGPFHDWKGPVLVLAMTRPTGFMVDPGAYRDAQLRDFRDAIDFVLDYGNDSHGQRLREVLETLGTTRAEPEAPSGTGESSTVHPEPPVGKEGTVIIEMEG